MKAMNKSNPGSAMPKVLISTVVLLMFTILVLKIVADKNGVKADAQPVPVVNETETGQPLPAAAKTLSVDSVMANSAAVSPVDSPAGKNLSVPVNAPEKECLWAFKNDPPALLRHFVQNYDATFFSMNGFRDDAELYGQFSDYAVCSILSGTVFPCIHDFQQICITAMGYEFINSSLNNRPDDGKCSRFVSEAFRKKDEAVSPGFCRVAAAALANRTAPDCEQLGTIKDCKSAFLFLKGREACSGFKNEAKKECLLSAALAAGDTASPEAWLPKVMDSRSPEVCVPLGEKLAVSYCTSKLRRQLLGKLSVIAASDAKQKALSERKNLDAKQKALKKD